MKIKYITLLFISIIYTNTGFSQENIEEQTNSGETNIIEVADSGFLDNFYIDTNTVSTEPVTNEESPAMTLLRIALITGMLGFLTWITLRFFFRRNALSLSTDGKSIEVLATIPAGLGSYFLIAKLSSLYYLFSLSSEGLRLLDKITDQEAIDFIELNKAQTLPQDIKFVDLLDNLPDGKPKAALEFLREKINHLKKK